MVRGTDYFQREQGSDLTWKHGMGVSFAAQICQTVGRSSAMARGNLDIIGIAYKRMLAKKENRYLSEATDSVRTLYFTPLVYIS